MKKGEEKGIVFIPSQRKREVLSVKFQEKLGQREESDVCTILGERERIHFYAFLVCVGAPHQRKRLETKVVESYHLDACSKMRKRVPHPLSTPPDGFEADYQLHRSRDCVCFVHHHTPVSSISPVPQEARSINSC